MKGDSNVFYFDGTYLTTSRSCADELHAFVKRYTLAWPADFKTEILFALPGAGFVTLWGAYIIDAGYKRRQVKNHANVTVLTQEEFIAWLQQKVNQ
jgi:hypothetical protein